MQPVETHYDSTGGVPVGNIFSRMALALRLGDFNFLISNQITSKSRVLFVRDVQQMAQKAAPFLTFDSNPYAVIANGEVQYVLDGYTTTDQYPYSENASNLNVNPGGLPGSFNYVRNSVKVVINAYTGAMTFYANDPNDPILKAYRSAFPTMFHPMSQMPEADPHAPALPLEHLLGPGRHAGQVPHLDGQRLLRGVGPLGGLADHGFGYAGAVTGAHDRDQQRRQRRLVVARADESDLPSRIAAPGEPSTAAWRTSPSCPAGNSATVQGLTAFMIATSDPSDYGQLHVYVTPRGQSVTGPVQADSEMQQNAAGSKCHQPAQQERITGAARQQRHGAAGPEHPLHPSPLRDQHVEPDTAVALHLRGLQPGRVIPTDARPSGVGGLQLERLDRWNAPGKNGGGGSTKPGQTAADYRQTGGHGLPSGTERPHQRRPRWLSERSEQP